MIGVGVSIARSVGQLVRYVLRDRFGDTQNPLTSGAGRTVTGARFFTKNGRLRGGAQGSSPTWGASKITYPSVPRVAGTALVALVVPEDAGSALALGFASSAAIADPRTDGHGWLIDDSYGLYAIAPGVRVAIANAPDKRHMQAAHYLAAVVLFDRGAVVLLSSFAADAGGTMSDPVGVPQYPLARVVWADSGANAGAAASLVPSISCERSGEGTTGYPDGHAIDDLDVVALGGVWKQPDGLAIVADRFPTDNAGSLGAGWTIDGGQGQVVSGQAQAVSGPGLLRAWRTAAADAIFQVDFTPAQTSPAAGIMLRRVDGNNFLRLWTNGAQAIALQSWVAGGFGDTIWQTGFPWVAGQTYRITVIAKGNRYKVLIDGVSQHGGDWIVDATNRHLAGTGFGLYGSDGQGTRWDNLACWPLVVTLPPEIQAGAQRPYIAAPGAVLLNETFAGSSGLPAGWTAETGTWARQNDLLVCTARAAGDNRVVFDLGSSGDREIEYEMVVPAGADMVNGAILAGCHILYTDSNNLVGNRAYMHSSQTGNDEIENLEHPFAPAPSAIVHKQNLADYWQAGTAYRFKLQRKGDLLHVLLWDAQASAWRPRTTYIHRQTGGTRIALFLDTATMSGLGFRNLVVRAL